MYFFFLSRNTALGIKRHDGMGNLTIGNDEQMIACLQGKGTTWPLTCLGFYGLISPKATGFQ
jgi:hypothetical protein